MEIFGCWEIQKSFLLFSFWFFWFVWCFLVEMFCGTEKASMH